ncbi:diguanylate cyclase [Aliiglaciecola litoralis]|uniref:diguanylate cyclase n=1 Tax=Aliiglaciecola litoralis TaxID=582857 RepID=A0ABN1LER8_9ALTE
MTTALEKKLTEFREKFKSEYHSQLAELIELWRAVREKKQTKQIGEFVFSVHKLKGSSSTLNFLNLSDRLNLIEQELDASKEDAKLLTKDLISFVDRHMNTLIASSKQSPDPVLEVVFREADHAAEHGLESPSLAKQLSPNQSNIKQSTNYTDITIALVDDDLVISALMSKLLVGFGFEVEHFSSLQEITKAGNLDRFQLILLDLIMSGSAQEQVFEFAKSCESKGIFVFILSSLNTFEARLAGIRAGVTDYLLKPISITSLVTKIRKTFKIDRFEPHKILLLDDQANVGNFYKALLEEKGIEVLALTDPHTLIQALESFHPDVFLLDMHMPDVSGIEVAKIIRQQPKYDYVPIIFLSGDTDVKSKLLALQCGADDLIPKKTPPAMLISQIDSRIVRGQKVRYLASRDSLTGVLNHGQIMEAAGQVHRLARRNKKPMNIAMIDIDLFKRVNDIHGHSGGDKVLIALGQLLMQSVRDTDYVGRYGGEEFMLVFGDSDTAAIEDRLNMMREAFNQIMFNVNEVSFNCSFSAGLASSEHHDKVSDLIASADKALYVAKDQGRNKVCVD